jgi:hypothetical protein
MKQLHPGTLLLQNSLSGPSCSSLRDGPLETSDLGFVPAACTDKAFLNMPMPLAYLRSGAVCAVNDNKIQPQTGQLIQSHRLMRSIPPSHSAQRAASMPQPAL